MCSKDLVRKTVSMASAARIKDDSNILRNIKKREVVNALKGNAKSLSLGGLGLSSSNKALTSKPDGFPKVNANFLYILYKLTNYIL